MKKVNFLATIAFVFGLISFSACTTEDLRSDASLTITALDDSQISSISDNIFASADEYVLPLELTNYAPVSGLLRAPITKTVDGVIITVDKSGTEYPKTITLDYGTTGIKDKRDNVLKGKIIIVVSNKMSVAGSSRSYSFVNFSVNDNKVMGTKVLTYNGATEGGPSWTVAVKDTVVKVDGTSIIVNSNRTRTLIDNNGTDKIYSDDSYSITGSASGVNAKGIAYTMKIEKPLIAAGGWPVFVQGSTLITSEKRTVLLDYGDGTKDLKATATIDGVTKEIILRKK